MKRADFSNMNTDILDWHSAYYSKYYGAAYIENQGLDDITDMIHRLSIPGEWIDLGSGTTSFIWLPAFQYVTRLISVDCDVEALFVQEHVRKVSPSGCYQHVLSRYNKKQTEMLNIPVDYYTEDLLDTRIPITHTFDNVTQLGLLGLCSSEEAYVETLFSLFRFVKPGGVFMGANWIFSKSYTEEMGFSNQYIDESLLQAFTSTNRQGVQLEYVKMVPIQNDLKYTSVLIYSLKSLLPL